MVEIDDRPDKAISSDHKKLMMRETRVEDRTWPLTKEENRETELMGNNTYKPVDLPHLQHDDNNIKQKFTRTDRVEMSPPQDERNVIPSQDENTDAMTKNSDKTVSINGTNDRIISL